MEWQDLVFGIGSIVFIIALIPTLLSKDKPPITTSLPTGIILGAFCFTYFTMDYYFAAITSGITSSMWLAIAIQKDRGW